MLQTDTLAQALTAALDRLARDIDSDDAHGLALDTLAKAQRLVARVADDSNLVLDPDLDSYYLQDLVTRKLERFVRQLAEVQILFREAAAANTPTNEQRLRLQIVEPMLRSIADELQGNLVAAYRGNPDGKTKEAVDGAFAALASSMNAYLGSLSGAFAQQLASSSDRADPDRHYGSVVKAAIEAWSVAQSELDRLLRQRIDGLMARMWWSLALIGLLAAFSILVAIMTHRHIVGPLDRLETVASTVRETRDYNLRVDYTSKNEIGQLASAFNDMLSELAAARERERNAQAEYMRAARLTTMGAMTASIAHEINQPLAAIAAFGNAGRRWLSGPQPDIDEARTALASIVKDAHRASQVIASVRAMFKNEGRPKVQVAVNDAIEDVLALMHREIRKQRIMVRAELQPDLPAVAADRTQLQQVLMNLFMNAIEAMEGITSHERLLAVTTRRQDQETVIITVEDSGIGIEANDRERIFDALFTTKSGGMGMGLSICRSIVETHGGRLWVSPGAVHGSVFHIVLPIGGR